ncbi:MAG: methylmalonyl-CoA epimerase [Candidatus Kapabacteria bacterium]|nr:methylmalonyl-CoA epimerase [Candidatus Kapabacteria bacterium]
MIKKLNHIGIAVKNLEQSIPIFQKIFGNESVHREIVSDQKVEIASFKVGDVIIELTSPTSEDSPISGFLEKRGEGIHHLAFESDDVQSDLNHLSQNSVKLINETPQLGAHNMLIAFLHPKSTNGVLIEICQHKD